MNQPNKEMDMPLDEQKLWHKRLNDWEPFDEITMTVVPRYKTSGLSGDEWRQSVRVEFKHKGVVVAEEGFSGMEYAAAFLPSLLVKLCQPIPEAVTSLDNVKCDQPSCRNDAVGRYLIKREFSSEGHALDPADQYGQKYRQFCSVHARRGDCSREDSDDNYEALDKLSPTDSTNTQESPAAMAPPICVEWVDDIPDALRKLRQP